MNEAYEAEAARIGGCCPTGLIRTAPIGARSFTRTWRVKIAILAVFVAAVGVGAGLGLWMKARQANDTTSSLANLRHGMPYSDARGLLFNGGWQPAAFPHQTAHERCYAREIICTKYIETESCSPTELAHCSFYFVDAYGKRLHIVTSGEEIEHLGVVNWEIK